PLGCSASKRLSTVLARSATQARTGLAMPSRSLAPRSLSSKRLPRSLRVASAMTTMFGSAISCSRAARFGVSPTMARSSASAARPGAPPRTNGPAAPPPPAASPAGGRRERVLPPPPRRNQLKPSPSRSLAAVLRGPRIAKVHEDAIPHISGDEPAEAAHGLGDAFLVGRNDLAQVLRVHACGKRSRTDQVREHHRDLAALGGVVGFRPRYGDGYRRESFGRRS